MTNEQEITIPSIIYTSEQQARTDIVIHSARHTGTRLPDYTPPYQMTLDAFRLVWTPTSEIGVLLTDGEQPGRVSVWFYQKKGVNGTRDTTTG